MNFLFLSQSYIRDQLFLKTAGFQKLNGSEKLILGLRQSEVMIRNALTYKITIQKNMTKLTPGFTTPLFSQRSEVLYEVSGFDFSISHYFKKVVSIRE